MAVTSLKALRDRVPSPSGTSGTLKQHAHGWQLLIMLGLFCSMLSITAKAQGTPQAGSVVAWGRHDFHQTDVPAAAAQGGVIAIASFSYGDDSMALLDNGTVVAWGYTGAGLTNVPDAIQGLVTAIAEGWTHSLALLRNRTVVAWGDQSNNKSNVPSLIQGLVTAIAAGVQHSIALLSNGVVNPWGDNSNQQQHVPTEIQGYVTHIAAGCYHNLALLKNRSVAAWGDNNSTQCDVPGGIQGHVTAIAAGCFHSLALLDNGTVAAWGNNSASQLSVPAAIQGHVTAIAGSAYNSMALLSNGTMVVWGDNSYNQTIVPVGIQGYVLDIAAGRNFSLAIVDANAPFFAPSPPPPDPQSVLPPSPPPPLNPPSVSPPSPPPPNPPSVLAPYPLPSNPPTPVSAIGRPVSGTSAGNSSKAGIAGGVAGAVVCVIIVVVVVLYSFNKKRRRNNSATNSNAHGDAKAVTATADFQDAALLPPLATITIEKHSDKIETSAKHTASSSQIPPYMGSTIGISGNSTPHWTYSLPQHPVSNQPHAQTGVDVTTAVQMRVLNTLRIRWSDIRLGQQIGQGGFGTVYMGSWQGNRVAIKMLNKEHLSQDARAALHHEVLMMCELRHPCIAPAYGLVDEGEHHALVMRYYKRGTLAAAMRTSAYQDLDLVTRLKIALQVATGILRLHEAQPRPIIHGDLKTSNILLEDDGSWRVVISDFGLACSVRTNNGQGTSQTAPSMTISISPPEVLQNPYALRTLAVDTYAFAIVLLEILQGTPLYRGMRAEEVVNAVNAGRRPGIPGTIPVDIAALVQACWSQDPAARPGFQECTERLKQSIDEHSGAGHDFLNTTTLQTNTTQSWY